MTLFAGLKEFDGKSTQSLERLDDRLDRNDATIEDLIAAAEEHDPKMQSGATWILKRWNDQQEPLIEGQITALAKLLKKVDHWEAKLHLLQLLSTHRLPAAVCRTLQKPLEALQRHENKFVRAWTYSVIAATAETRKSLREPTCQLLDQAETTEAASVKARIRQIRKNYAWAKSSR
ncbi:hypothetical protein [Roseiconus lacunae]|uniref:HEAT repeat domain-containing protein n=1 Tax=Roseiconus lacunae TaxID=2605694 RepID=A0ABT7PF85_9BACT|nr:hypothetical protein [Roseiconus lacunae]MDM4015164.1 hypothetical protein [Roseiconus lacunae]